MLVVALTYHDFRPKFTIGHHGKFSLSLISQCISYMRNTSTGIVNREICIREYNCGNTEKYDEGDKVSNYSSGRSTQAIRINARPQAYFPFVKT